MPCIWPCFLNLFYNLFFLKFFFSSFFFSLRIRFVELVDEKRGERLGSGFDARLAQRAFELPSKTLRRPGIFGAARQSQRTRGSLGQNGERMVIEW